MFYTIQMKEYDNEEEDVNITELNETLDTVDSFPTTNDNETIDKTDLSKEKSHNV